jgi:hypothetical protein
MLPHPTESCLDEWLADYDVFKDAILRYCYAVSKALRYYPYVNFDVLKKVHNDWKASCDSWESRYISQDSNGLSHLKIMTILLAHLALNDWVAGLQEFDPESDGEHSFEFNGTPEERDSSRKDLNAGRGTFLGYQFVSAILNSFEQSRDDKVQQYEYRMTNDLEHDLMVFLSWERDHQQDKFLFEMALFLFFKALFVRDTREEIV